MIAVMKVAPIPWKNTHPYIVPDRYEHSREGANIDDNELVDVSFYGWIRGTTFRLNNKIHIIGLGDYEIEATEVIEDPVPVVEVKIHEDKNTKKKEGGDANEDGDDEGSEGDDESSDESEDEDNQPQEGKKEEPKIKKIKQKRTLK